MWERHEDYLRSTFGVGGASHSQPWGGAPLEGTEGIHSCLLYIPRRSVQAAFSTFIFRSLDCG